MVWRDCPWGCAIDADPGRNRPEWQAPAPSIRVLLGRLFFTDIAGRGCGLQGHKRRPAQSWPRAEGLIGRDAEQDRARSEGEKAAMMKKSQSQRFIIEIVSRICFT